MFIRLKLSAIFKSSKIYLINVKNWEMIDTTFDKLQKQSKLHYTTQFIAYNYLMFIIWRDTSNDWKRHVVINIRDLNEIMKNDIYSLLLQFDIIVNVADFSFISIFNAVNYFHQFNVQYKNREKFTIISHREQKEFNIVLMKYKSSSFYV